MRGRIFILISLVLVPSAWGRVLLRWTQPTVPPSKQLGVTQLVISWNSNSSTFLETAHQQGYRMYVQATPEQVPQIAAPARKLTAGIVLEIAASQQPQAGEILKKFRAQYPSLTFLLLDPNGKQPQMRGTMVIKREGVLEITSPTAQPWIDSNVPLVRFEQGFHPEQVPLYTFAWDTSDPLQQKQGPTAAEYSLAIAEAGALHSDLILNVHENLQKGLSVNDTGAWTFWKKIKPYLEFASTVETPQPEASIGIVTKDYDSAYEPMNLMARHNIPFRVIPAGNLTAQVIAGLKMLLLFTAPNTQAASAIADFASVGGTVVAAGLSGSYPWQTAPTSRVAEHSTSYAIGKGQVLELSEPVADPETFAQDVRRLMKGQDILVSLWNALTTIGVPYRDSRTGTTLLELVNYSGESLRVQTRMKGLFHSIRLETPEHGCCRSLPAIQHDGFMEFVVPELQATARVHLESAPKSH
jgi:hypothetical protein